MREEIARQGPESKAGVASAEQGLVLLDGPNGVAISMTPEAADGTGRSLIAAAAEAEAQRSGHSQSS